MMKIEEHDAIVLWLDKQWKEEDEDLTDINPEPSPHLVKRLEKWLKNILANPQHCPNCGVLKHEIMVLHEGTEYWFALYKIIKKKSQKIIAKTDYKRFGHYCEGHPKRASLDAAKL